MDYGNSKRFSFAIRWYGTRESRFKQGVMEKNEKIIKLIRRKRDGGGWKGSHRRAVRKLPLNCARNQIRPEWCPISQPIMATGLCAAARAISINVVDWCERGTGEMNWISWAVQWSVSNSVDELTGGRKLRVFWDSIKYAPMKIGVPIKTGIFVYR